MMCIMLLMAFGCHTHGIIIIIIIIIRLYIWIIVVQETLLKIAKHYE